MPASVTSAMRLARREASQQQRPHPLGIVLVIGQQPGLEPVLGEQPGRHPRVLAGDPVGAGQHRERAQRDVVRLPIGVPTTVSPGGAAAPPLDLLPGAPPIGSWPSDRSRWRAQVEPATPIRRLSAWSSPRRSLLLLLAVAGAALAGCTPAQKLPVSSSQGQAAVPAPAPVATAVPTPMVPTSPGAPIRIGLLLPLSGNSANLGQAMLQAAQMALFEVGGDDVALIVRDTEAVPTAPPPRRARHSTTAPGSCSARSSRAPPRRSGRWPSRSACR